MSVWFPERRSVYLGQDGKIWLGYNSEALPPPPCHTIFSPKALQLPQYCVDQYIWSCMVLKDSVLKMVASSCCIAAEFSSVQIDCVEGWYVLDSHQLDSWVIIEKACVHLCQVLWNCVPTTLTFSVLVFPFKLGYQERFRSRKAAYKAFEKSRHAFICLFGVVSYLILRAKIKGIDWIGVAERGGITDNWSKALSSSPISDFTESSSRVGMLVDLSDGFISCNELRDLILSNVPIWIYWHNNKDYFPKNASFSDLEKMTITRYRPSQGEIDNVKLTFSEHDFMHDIDEAPFPGHPSFEMQPESHNEASIPPVDPHDGSHCITGQVEGGPGQLPYEIPKVSKGRNTGHEAIDANYSSNQERSSRVRHERNICTEFRSDNDSDDDYRSPPPSTLRMTTSTQRSLDEQIATEIGSFELSNLDALPDELKLPPSFYSEVLRERFLPPRDVEVRRLSYVGLEDILYPRYGILVDKAAAAASNDSTFPPTNPKSFADSRAILCDGESETPSFGTEQLNGIAYSVTKLLQGSEIPADIFDIHPLNSCRQRLLGNPMVHQIIKCQLDFKSYAIITPSSTKVVGLRDASLVVEILRRMLTSWNDVIFLLVMRGSPFRFLELGALPVPTPHSDPHTIEFREENDPPNSADYQAYEMRFRSFLLQRRGCAILSLGGPLWRLAIEVLDAEKFETDSKNSNPQAYFSLNSGEILREEILTEDDLRLLCGTYAIRKGMLLHRLDLSY